MLGTKRRLMTLGVALLAMTFSLATPAAAQDDPARSWRDPAVQLRKETTPYLPWLAAALFTAAIAAVSFKHPRRGKND